MRKLYLALVSPPPARRCFEVEGPLGRMPGARRPRFGFAAGGRASHSRFRVLGAAGGRALVLAEPTTGRTHQLRVHLAARGCPVVGDVLYGAPCEPGSPAHAERVQLHALRLELPARAGRAALALEAPLPDDFEGAGLARPLVESSLLPCAPPQAAHVPPGDAPVVSNPGTPEEEAR